MTLPNAGKDAEQRELVAGGKAKWYSHFGRQVGSFLHSHMMLPYDLAIQFLDIQPRETKIHIHTKVCTQIFIHIVIHNNPKVKIIKLINV